MSEVINLNNTEQRFLSSFYKRCQLPHYSVVFKILKLEEHYLLFYEFGNTDRYLMELNSTDIIPIFERIINDRYNDEHIENVIGSKKCLICRKNEVIDSHLINKNWIKQLGKVLGVNTFEFSVFGSYEFSRIAFSLEEFKIKQNNNFRFKSKGIVSQNTLLCNKCDTKYYSNKDRLFELNKETNKIVLMFLSEPIKLKRALSELAANYYLYINANTIHRNRIYSDVMYISDNVKKKLDIYYADNKYKQYNVLYNYNAPVCVENKYKNVVNYLKYVHSSDSVPYFLIFDLKPIFKGISFSKSTLLACNIIFIYISTDQTSSKLIVIFEDNDYQYKLKTKLETINVRRYNVIEKIFIDSLSSDSAIVLQRNNTQFESGKHLKPYLYLKYDRLRNEPICELVYYIMPNIDHRFKIKDKIKYLKHDEIETVLERTRNIGNISIYKYIENTYDFNFACILKDKLILKANSKIFDSNELEKSLRIIKRIYNRLKRIDFYKLIAIINYIDQQLEELNTYRSYVSHLNALKLKFNCISFLTIYGIKKINNKAYTIITNIFNITEDELSLLSLLVLSRILILDIKTFKYFSTNHANLEKDAFTNIDKYFQLKSLIA